MLTMLKDSEKNSLSSGKPPISDQPLTQALRLRSGVRSTDEESRIESTLPAASEPTKEKNTIKTKSLFERTDSIREETRKFFDEIIASTPCIFLCWGRPGDCRVIQVPIEDRYSWKFQQLHDAWYAARGKWRRWLPLFGIVSVEPVQIQFAGKLKPRIQNKIKSSTKKKKNDDEPQTSGHRTFSTYTGIYNPVIPKEDKDAMEKELLERTSKIEARIDAAWHSLDHDYLQNDLCGRHSQVDEWESCGDGKCQYCDENGRDGLFDKVANERRHSMITLCFRDPSLDAAPHIAFSKRWWTSSVVGVVAQQDLLEQLKYGHQACRISNIVVPGLVVQEDWLDWKESALLPLLVCFFFAVVVGSRYLLGDWQTGLTAGGCFVAFLTIPVLWVSHAVRR